MVDLISVAGNILLFSLVFGMSATVDISCMKAQLQNYKAICTGMFCQFIILPFLGFVVVRCLQMDHGMGITLLVVTSSPGGSYSNWFASMFNADLALSVSMTAISTVLSIFMLPANLLLYTKLAYHDDDVVSNLDWNALFLALIIVITAICIGLYCSASIKSRKFNKVANHIGNGAGVCLILFSATMTNTGSSDSKIWSRHWTFYVGVALPCVGGLVLANFIASGLQLHRPERVTVAIECCYQNVGIATSLALTMFEGEELNLAMGVPFFYGVVEAALVSSYCFWAWKAGWTKAPSDAPFWRVMLTSYEVLEYEMKDLDTIEVSISESDEDREHAQGNVFMTYFNMESWCAQDTTTTSTKATTDSTKAETTAATSTATTKSSKKPGSPGRLV